jgi:hypothetical protein
MSKTTKVLFVICEFCNLFLASYYLGLLALVFILIANLLVIYKDYLECKLMIDRIFNDITKIVAIAFDIKLKHLNNQEIEKKDAIN